MKTHSLKLAIAASAMTAFLAGCGDDVLVTEKTDQAFTTVSALDPDDCNSKSEGTMAFVKKNSTMYVCTDGEWVAMNDQDAIEYRCETKALKDKSGFELICDGESIGVFKNGENGENGKSGTSGKNGSNGDDGDGVDMDELEKSIDKSIGKGKAEVEDDLNKKLSSASAKSKSDLDSKLSSASEKVGKDADKKLSSASAKHDKEINDLDKKLSSASAKNKKDNKDISDELDDINDNVLSSASKSQDEFDKKLSSLADEYDKSCRVADEPKTSEDGNTITVSVKCGDATKEFVIDLLEENLKNVYKKHVVVRFPVQSEKTTRSEDIYEEIWANLKGGNHAELTVTDLNKNLDATGNLFVTDLFADATKKGSFVTVEGTNEKTVQYKIVRLEGDLDITNLSTPVVQLHVTLKLGNYWVNEELALNAIVDLTDKDIEKADASDTVVIDFLTDYKAARVKNLVKGGEAYNDADELANAQVAEAFALNSGDDVYPALEHYLPNKAEFNEYFNSVVWEVALLDQLDIVQDFNRVYSDFRKSLAENGNLNNPVKTSFRGEEREMYFGDYLFLLIYTNFYKYRHNGDDPVYYRGRCTDDDPVCNSVNYNIVQKYFKDIYGLDDTSGKDWGDGLKIAKSKTEDGYFNYFVYDEAEKIWYPLEDLATIVKFEGGECDAENAGKTLPIRINGVDYTSECVIESGSDRGEWVLDENVELPDPSGNAKNGKTIDEILNPAEGEGPLGKCTDEIYKDEKKNRKLFDDLDAERSTMTGHTYYICNGKKWVRESWVDEKLGICSETVMKLGEVKKLPGTSYYKCDYLDKEDSYAWVDDDVPEMSRGACHYGIAEQRVVNEDGSLGEVIKEGEMSEDGYYECRTTGTDNNGNLVHSWVELTVSEYCVGDRIEANKQRVEGETLPDNMTYNQKCSYRNVPYVRNNPSGDTEPSDTWVSVEEYVQNVYGSNGPRQINARRGVARVNAVAALTSFSDGYYVFLNGYRDAAVYWCSSKYQSCSMSSDEDILESWRKGEIAESQALRILGDLEYDKVAVGTYIDAVKFEMTLAKFVENANVVEKNVKIVASATRTDWHVESAADVYGECTVTVMADGSKNWQKFRGLDHKCDCEKDGDSYKSCAWVEGSEKEIELNSPCTVNLVGSFTEDNKLVCRNATSGHDWSSDIADYWCHTHGKNFEGEKEIKGICDDVPGDNTTYLLIGQASSWADVPDPYEWNDDNITTADKEAIKKQLISGNSCAKTDIVDLLYDYTIEGTTGHVNDLVCVNGKLRVPKDLQEACGAAYETTEFCKYMVKWYVNDNGTWRKPTCDDVSTYPDVFFCDARDASNPTVYRMVTIGEGENEQTWMAENLNYKTENSVCGGGAEGGSTEGDCSVYGRLYTKADAFGKSEDECNDLIRCNIYWDSPIVLQGVCPTGWHLPDTTEWRILVSNVDPNFVDWNNDNSAGQYLKAKNRWNVVEGIENKDTYSFSALPAGYYRRKRGLFKGEGRASRFWSSTEKPFGGTGEYSVYVMILVDDRPDASLESIGSKNGYSVRCIKNNDNTLLPEPELPPELPPVLPPPPEPVSQP